MLHPLWILAIGVVVVLVTILWLRLNAFLGLIIAALTVSLLTPGEPADNVASVAAALGNTTAGIGIAIVLAAIIGSLLVASGAADRIVEASLKLFGESRGAGAMAASGFVLSVPVFFDTVFYLLFPLARSMYRRTGRCYLRYLLAIGAGGAVTHTMVPPTPGPLLMADNIGVDVGLLMLVGGVVAVPMTLTGLAFAAWRDRRMTREIEIDDDLPDVDPEKSAGRPGLLVSMLPILIPILFISLPAVLGERLDELPGWLPSVLRLLADKNVALLMALFAALAVYCVVRRPRRQDVAQLVEHSVVSAGSIVLITAAGGAFGGMLKQADVGPAIQGLFESHTSSAGFVMLWIAFFMTSLIKCAQGSTTIALVTGSSMVGAMLQGTEIALHPVYFCTAIGSGAMITSWLNDSGFWLFCRMGHLTEEEGMTTWVPLTALMGVAGMATTVLLASIWPGVAPAVAQ
ncbi:GntP family permease [Aeoliella sp. ICT_H6.2]|uniref:GntP family permease n=1 Tax=Aeoliella straminimaris TaxID=2954799 RepID=A0A9X2FE35_9BACT|nr:GntP family permease [Aeoliella straminimaris]MCO6047295.1 GntP family permease [Aeoliella straminimaris]